MLDKLDDSYGCLRTNSSSAAAIVAGSLLQTGRGADWPIFQGPGAARQITFVLKVERGNTDFTESFDTGTRPAAEAAG